jgi:hypothetical protein
MTADYRFGAIYREDMDRERCSTPGCNCSSDVLHLHSTCRHGDRYLDIGCHHPSHVLVLGCERCECVLWAWHLAPHGDHHPDEPGAGPCTWGWSDWDELAEGHEYTRIRFCHPDETEITYVKAGGEVRVQCTAAGCKRSKAGNGYLRYAIGSRGGEKVQ